MASEYSLLLSSAAEEIGVKLGDERLTHFDADRV